MRPFLSAASNAILRPGGLLRWKVRLVKDASFSRPLTEVMKIARFTSPLLNAPRQSSPRPKLRHGRRLALLFCLNLTLNLYTLFFAISLVLLPPLLTSPTVLPRGNRLWSSPITWSVHSFPSIWKTSSIILIHKMEKPLDSPASFRPISLTSCVSKRFERIILFCQLFFLESISILSPR